MTESLPDFRHLMDVGVFETERDPAYREILRRNVIKLKGYDYVIQALGDHNAYKDLDAKTTLMGCGPMDSLQAIERVRQLHAPTVDLYVMILKLMHRAVGQAIPVLRKVFGARRSNTNRVRLQKSISAMNQNIDAALRSEADHLHDVVPDQFDEEAKAQFASVFEGDDVWGDMRLSQVLSYSNTWNAIPEMDAEEVAQFMTKGSLLDHMISWITELHHLYREVKSVECMPLKQAKNYLLFVKELGPESDPHAQVVNLDHTRVKCAEEQYTDARTGVVYAAPTVTIDHETGPISDRRMMNFATLRTFTNLENVAQLVNIMLAYDLFGLARNWWIKAHATDVSLRTEKDTTGLVDVWKAVNIGRGFRKQIIDTIEANNQPPIELSRNSFKIMCSQLMNTEVDEGPIFNEMTLVLEPPEIPLIQKSKTAHHIRVEGQLEKIKQEIDERANRPDRGTIQVTGGVKIKPVDVYQEAEEQAAREQEEGLQRNILKQRQAWEKAQQQGAPVPTKSSKPKTHRRPPN